MKTPKVFDVVTIVWEDAQTHATVQYDSPVAAVAAYKPCLRRSIGMWVGWARKDGRRVALIATDDDRGEESPEAIGGISQIPRGMIVAIEPVAKPPARRRR